jgi:hypothetical protein
VRDPLKVPPPFSSRIDTPNSITAIIIVTRERHAEMEADSDWFARLTKHVRDAVDDLARMEPDQDPEARNALNAGAPEPGKDMPGETCEILDYAQRLVKPSRDGTAASGLTHLKQFLASRVMEENAELTAADKTEAYEAILALGRGEYERKNWEAFERRYLLNYCGRRVIPRAHYWDGSPLNGATLAIFCEGGYGDSVQFLRYAPLAKASGAGRVLAMMRERLIPLYQCAVIDECHAVTTSTVNFPRHDVAVPVMSFPLIQGTTLHTIPPPWIPKPPDAAIEQASARIGHFGLKIGLSWAASLKSRSFHLSQYKPLTAIPGVRLFGFQRGAAADQLREVDFKVTNLETPESSMADTAAAMSCMDAIVTADTFTCHLAGSLGLRTFTVLPRHTEWRWGVSEDTTPWYPSMRLFRQPQQGDWGGAIARVVKQLLSRD